MPTFSKSTIQENRIVVTDSNGEITSSSVTLLKYVIFARNALITKNKKQKTRTKN